MSTTLKHLALIPDGNRRWAKSVNRGVLDGHRVVVDKVFPELVSEALALKLPYFTIWGFSTENWRRSPMEIEGILTLVKMFLTDFAMRLKSQGVRLNFIGRRNNLPADLNKLIDQALATTAAGTAMTLTIAYNYGGRDEIVRAANALLQEQVSEITLANLSQALDTGMTNLPDPDLIIRTGGEQRLSGFMSWQAAYSELYFSAKMMPEWTRQDLRLAVADYANRQRRFGK